MVGWFPKGRQREVTTGQRSVLGTLTRPQNESSYYFLIGVTIQVGCALCLLMFSTIIWRPLKKRRRGQGRDWFWVLGHKAPEHTGPATSQEQLLAWGDNHFPSSRRPQQASCCHGIHCSFEAISYLEQKTRFPLLQMPWSIGHFPVRTESPARFRPAWAWRIFSLAELKHFQQQVQWLALRSAFSRKKTWPV